MGSGEKTEYTDLNESPTPRSRPRPKKNSNYCTICHYLCECRAPKAEEIRQTQEQNKKKAMYASKPLFSLHTRLTTSAPSCAERVTSSRPAHLPRDDSRQRKTSQAHAAALHLRTCLLSPIYTPHRPNQKDRNLTLRVRSEPASSIATTAARGAIGCPSHALLPHTVQSRTPPPIKPLAPHPHARGKRSSLDQVPAHLALAPSCAALNGTQGPMPASMHIDPLSRSQPSRPAV
ncbi:hypothetical protein BS50DRAFT_93651 [Corynespora cassiicola Philippines]|uniref:Uncharacterized protein n=1 Tax=Corynespora cassiicola Philippines TaxID=1448308 RepID=A0A2T2NEU8_CORCC|nr:hypothetical protein BS50DRAFT_93651 [Corynespora cassiicola Philippines]